MKSPGNPNNPLSNLDMRRLAPIALVALVVLIWGTASFGWWFLLVGIAFYAILAAVLLPNPNRRAAGLAGALPGGETLNLDLSRLDGRYRESVERALDRRKHITRAIADTGDPGIRRALTDSTRDLDALVNAIYELGVKGQSVQSAMSSSQTMRELSQDIERLNNLINSTTDEFQKSQYHATLDAKLQQMQNFTDTTVAVQRWDAQMDNALATMDTLLSQVLRIKSSEVLSQSGATDDMSRTLRTEVESLKATSDALDSLYRT